MSIKRKLLLVTAGFPFGDSERSFLTTEFQHLQEKFDITILALNNSLPLIFDMPKDVIVERYILPPIKRYGTFFKLHKLLNRDVFKEMKIAVKYCKSNIIIKRLKMIITSYLNALEAKKKLCQLVKKNNIDLIYTYWCTDVTIGAVLLKKKLPNIKVITRFHGIDLYRERKEAEWQCFRVLIGDKCDKMCFACKAALNYFVNTWGEKYEVKSHVYYLGSKVVLNRNINTTGEFTIISCSNMIPLKRINLIIDGLALLSKNIKVKWHHFGDGELRVALEEYAKKTILNSVDWCFHGHMKNEELIKSYIELGAQLFISTSSTEGGVPVSIMEASSIGIPTIATAVGGIPEIVISGETGILLDKDITGQNVKDAILSYYFLPENIKKIYSSNAAKKWNSTFNAETNAIEFERMLRILIDKNEENNK